MDKETLSLAEMTREDLRDKINTHNRELNLTPKDPGYLKSGGKKADLIDQLLVAEAFQEAAGTVLVESDVRTTAKARQLEVHGSNFRHMVDYHDPDLRAAFKNSGMRFFQELTVTETGTINEDGEMVFRIVSGNRSFSNFVALCEEEGLDVNSFDIPVCIRTYSGTEQERHASEIMDIALANELQRSMSPVDRCRQYNELGRAGYTQGDIARAVYGVNAKGKQPIISGIMRLRLLPERVLDLVHFKFHANVLASNGIEFLAENNIPFSVNEKTAEITVHGISLENAKEMNKLWPRAKNPDREELEQRVSAFLEREEVISAAVELKTSKFKGWLRDEAVAEGLIVSKTKVKSVSEESSDTEETTETSSSSKTKPDYELDWAGDTRYEVAADLLNGELVLREDSVRRLSEALETNAPGVFTAVKVLCFEGILVPTELDDL